MFKKNYLLKQGIEVSSVGFDAKSYLFEKVRCSK